jgi:cytochrome c oxidase subunit I+III
MEVARMAEIAPNSVRYWLFTTNHKNIGILYLVTSFYFLLVGGALALLFRLQLAMPQTEILSASSFNQAVTVHGLVMVLWFLSPLAFALANYIVPLQIGANDLAFPRLNALSYWLYLFGGVLAAIGFFTPGGAIDTGWTVYAPLNTAKYSPQVGTTLGALGLLMLIASVTASTVNFLVTIFKMRAPGMRLMHMPMYTWGILLTVFLMLFAFPALAAAGLVLAADRALGTLYFVSQEGGALLWDNLFWFFGHPEVYIVLLPGLFAVAEILPVFARRPLYGKRVIIWASVAASILSLMVWGHHMFTTGVNPLWREVMTVLTETISIPFGVITISFILTLVGASIRLKTPMLFALASLVHFIIGGITGVFNSSVALDYGLRGTYWVVGHFHYTLLGGAATGLIAGLYYWWPKISGRMYDERLGRIHFILYVVGYNLFAFSIHLLIDMPRRVYTYPLESGWLLNNMVATTGALIFGLSFLLLFFNLYRSLRKGAEAGPNPWSSWSLEWLTPSPPPPENYGGQPVVSADGVISITPLPIDGGRHMHVNHLSKAPMLVSLGTFAVFLGLALSMPIALVGLAILAASLIIWARESWSSHHMEGLEFEKWPFQGVEKTRLGVWWLIFGEAVLFSGLILSYLWVRFMSASWPAAGTAFDLTTGAANTFILLTSSFTLVAALAAARLGRHSMVRAGLLTTFALGLVFLLNKALEWAHLFAEGHTFGSSLPFSTFYVTTGAHGAHVLAGLIVLVYLIVRSFRKTEGIHESVESFGIYWHFVDIVWVFLFPLFYLF